VSRKNTIEESPGYQQQSRKEKDYWTLNSCSESEILQKSSCLKLHQESYSCLSEKSCLKLDLKDSCCWERAQKVKASDALEMPESDIVRHCSETEGKARLAQINDLT
jgi:hypothetical protein